MRKLYLLIGVTVILTIILLKNFLIPSYDIVIYGGGFAGSAAARNAAAAAPDKRILLIVPDTSQRLGGLGTVGGQNFTDIRHWQGQLVTAGSFGRWYAEAGQFYNTKAMSEIITRDLAQFKNLTILYSQDLRSIQVANSLIRGINLAPIARGQDGMIRWGQGEKRIKGRVFIDASDEGKLATLSGAQLSVGREDWPDTYLAEDERKDAPLQQAATLMFKVTGVKAPVVPMKVGDLEFAKDNKGSWGLVGGKETWEQNQVVTGYNQVYAEQGFAIKPINAAQDGANSGEWWVNMLLVFNVDGRLNARDQENRAVQLESKPGSINIDQAWISAREILDKPEFLHALRQFRAVSPQGELGFGEASLVRDSQNLPVVGEVMYIRESIHSLAQGGVNPIDQENIAYALTTLEAQQAGKNSTSGVDSGNYPERIGLAYYLMDINAYKPQDLLQEGRYHWPVTGYLRPDWQARSGQPINPVYLPYRILVNPSFKNLLVPGYAASSSSMAWAELRVLPNLTVLGDAAGVAAARAALNKEWPAEFGPEQVEWVQTKLRQFGARLDK